jgi:hypothetical protein
MKRILFNCLFLTNLFAFPIAGFSQFVTVPTKINTPYGKVTVPTQQYAPWMHHNNYSGYSNQKHRFHIVLLNDSIIEAKASINISDSVHYLEWGKREKKTIIKPAETKEIYRMDFYNKKITGIPHDSCWLFPVDTGKIRTYSIVSDIDYPLIAYIQEGNEKPILPLAKENLLPMVSGNKKAIKLAEKEKLLKAIDVYNNE